MTTQQKDDGGTAFPIGLTQDGPCGGLTKREWFAGQALRGLLSDASWPGDVRFDPERDAKIAFKFADAMIAESKKWPTPRSA